MMIGNFGQGERGRGNMSAVWDGTTGINIPYFGSQAPWNFYLKVNRPWCENRVNLGYLSWTFGTYCLNRK